MANVIIPEQHQSSPKQTDLDKSIRRAIGELRDGTFKPVINTENFDPSRDDQFRTGTELLEQHPLVQEAMRKLETRVVDKTNNEYLEKAQQLHELNVMAAREFRWEGQERWEGEDNEAQRTVNVMSPKQFILKLQAAKISAELVPHTEPEMHVDPNGLLNRYDCEKSSAKICLGATVYKDLVALRAWVNGEYVMVDKLQVPCGPEWTVMRFDDLNIPTTEKYHGWRTAVLALIIRRVITEEEALLAFGPVTINDASSFYRQQLHQWRSEGLK